MVPNRRKGRSRGRHGIQPGAVNQVLDRKKRIRAGDQLNAGWIDNIGSLAIADERRPQGDARKVPHSSH